MLTVHQTVSDVRGNFYQEKTVFLRCTVNSNPPARFIWKRGSDTLSHSQDNGVDIYEPLYTQVRTGGSLLAAHPVGGGGGGGGGCLTLTTSSDGRSVHSDWQTQWGPEVRERLGGRESPQSYASSDNIAD